FVQLLEQTQEPGPGSEYLRIIDGESDRLKALIDTILDHARIERGVMEYYFANADLNACIGEAVEPLRYLMEMQSFDFELVLAPDPLPIEADRAVLHTAFTNILS